MSPDGCWRSYPSDRWSSHCSNSRPDKSKSRSIRPCRNPLQRVHIESLKIDSALEAAWPNRSKCQARTRVKEQITFAFDYSPCVMATTAPGRRRPSAPGPGMLPARSIAKAWSHRPPQRQGNEDQERQDQHDRHVDQRLPEHRRRPRHTFTRRAGWCQRRW